MTLFLYPYACFGLAASLALLFWLFFRTGQARRRLFALFTPQRPGSPPPHSFSPARQRWKYALVLLGLTGLFLSLARPQWGFEWRVSKGRGIDILFALDASRSMLADDLVPNRLVRARLAVQDLLGRLQGDRVGLVAFSGSAFLQCPLTLDYDAFRQSLLTVVPGIIPRGGSDLAAALQEASATFDQNENFKFLILITDGEDLAGSGLEEARRAARHGIRIFTVGVGTAEGARIPLATTRGRVDFLRDASGQYVRTRLDESTLRSIAEETGGFYVPLGPTGEGLLRIYEEGLASVPRQELESRLEQIPLERYQWFLLPAILILLLEMMLDNRRRPPAQAALPPGPEPRRSASPAPTPPPSPSRQTLAAPARALGLLLSSLLAAAVLPHPAPAASPHQAGLEAFSQGDFAAAAEAFSADAERRAADPRVHFNLGSARFKSGDFPAARQSFQEALATTDLDLQADTFYNLANTAFELGKSALATDPAATVREWEQAVNGFENSLQLRPGDPDAAANLKTVRALLDQLKQQQQQQQQNQDQDSQQQDQQDQQDGQQKDSRDDSSKQDSPDQNSSDKSPGQDSSSGQNQQDSNPSSDSNRAPSPPSPSPSPESPPDSPDRTPLEDRSIEAADPSAESPPPQQQPSSGSPDPTATPLRMTRQEAAQLLDALRQQERKLPLKGYGQDVPAADGAQIKDW